MFFNTLVLAWRSIRRNLLRSFLTVLGIVIGVAAVVTMVTLGNGATRMVADQIASLGSNLLILRPGQQLGPGRDSAGAPNFKLADVDALQAQMNDPKTASKFQQAQDKQQYLNNLSDYSGMLNQISDAFKNVGGISSANIEKIAGSAAGDAVFTNLSVNASQMSLTGTASRMEMVSSVAANLMNTQLFSEVSVGSVNYTGGRYEFQMGCKLKGGSVK